MPSTDLDLGDDPTSSLVAPSAEEAEVLGDSDAAIASAAAAMGRAEREIDDLWHDAVVVEDPQLSERLVEVSHALRRAAYLLDEDSIG